MLVRVIRLQSGWAIAENKSLRKACDETLIRRVARWGFLNGKAVSSWTHRRKNSVKELIERRSITNGSLAKRTSGTSGTSESSRILIFEFRWNSWAFSLRKLVRPKNTLEKALETLVMVLIELSPHISWIPLNISTWKLRIRPKLRISLSVSERPRRTSSS